MLRSWTKHTVALRRVSVWLVVTVLAVAFISCTGTPAAPPAAPGTEAETPQAADRSGGTLTIAHLSDIDNLEPNNLSNSSYPMFNLVYNVLTRYDETITPQPELAVSWEFNEDYTTLTLQLREGVMFHSGREFMADDVVYNVNLYKSEEFNANIRPLFGPVQDVVAVDDSTVEITFDKPWPGIFDAFDLMFIVDKELAREELQQRGGGTGPFQVAEWDPGNLVRFERFEDYWKEGRPYLDEVVLQVAPDEQAMVASLEAGAFDAIDSVGLEEYARLRVTGSYNTLQANYALVVDLLLNTQKAPFDNKQVRQAMHYAIDRERIVEDVFGGVGRATCLPSPPGSLAYSEELDQPPACEFNLERAQQLLEEAGYGDGFSDTLLVTSSLQPGTDVMAQIIQSDLRGIGVDMQIQDVERPSYFEQIFFPPEGQAPSYSIALHNFGRANKDPASLFGTARVWWPEGNPSQFESDEYQQLVEEGATTTDEAAREAIYEEILELVLDEAFVLSITPRQRPFVAQSNVQDLRLNLDGMVILDDAYIAE